ncbi:MAG: HEPN domain-containing protein [Candidatus Delongbacteria bacterium]|nr:HEPN domain-containing protein [Candidatus Delongbacteria bacterium]MCG2760844.1 HEPN domain-containing protein [Candidatus Delongbacteria bacterium]
MEQKDMVNHWVKSAEQDYTAMEHLFEKKDYSWSLFVGHLVIEKLLKAYFIKVKNEQPPLIHNLLRIAEKADLKLTESQMDDLTVITSFNIEARYEDYKTEFYKKCTPNYSKKWFKKINEYKLWLMQILLK